MTADKQWETAGMGATGETFVVGPDGLMRSDSRLFLENPEKFERDVIDAGTPPAVAAKSLRQHGTTLVQPVETTADPVGPARPERHRDRGRLPGQ